MDDYQKEQFDAYSMVMQYLSVLSEGSIRQLVQAIEEYLIFRGSVNEFLSTHFSDVCHNNCYSSRKSACCSKEGIVTFFADVLINVLKSDKKDIDVILSLLKTKNKGFKCIYLGEGGCVWKLKPIVCEMFLCQKAKSEVFEKKPELAEAWGHLKDREKQFTWPDQPVLFDDLEAVFINAGYISAVMYLHNSPGLLRVKKMAQHGKKI